MVASTDLNDILMPRINDWIRGCFGIVLIKTCILSSVFMDDIFLVAAVWKTFYTIMFEFIEVLRQNGIFVFLGSVLWRASHQNMKWGSRIMIVICRLDYKPSIYMQGIIHFARNARSTNACKTRFAGISTKSVISLG